MGVVYEEVNVPRAAVQFPLRVPLPPDFEVARLETWPHVNGRLEFVGGELWFMPPCGEEQQLTAADVATELGIWRRAHPEFAVGANEAGVLLGGDLRGAEALVFRRADLRGGRQVPRVPPILAVEVCGRDDSIDSLRTKARWYLDHGVAIVWILEPRTREVVVIDERGERNHGPGGTVPEDPRLPGLAPKVDDLFRQVG
jgi:Uma2 family endonuclease